MPTAKRGDDVKVIVAATLAVLAFGGLIFAGVFFSTRGGKSPQCGQLSLGSADSVRREITDAGGPWFQTGGGSCSFWLALNGGQIVAYKLHIPDRDCTVTWNGSFHCGGEVVAESELAQYPVSIVSKDGIDEVLIDLRTPAERARDNARTTSST